MRVINQALTGLRLTRTTLRRPIHSDLQPIHGGVQWRQDRWAGTRWSTVVHGLLSCALADAGTAPPRRRTVVSRGCSRSSVVDSPMLRAPSANLNAAAGARITGPPTLQEWRVRGPRKVQSVVEWATPTSYTELRRLTGPANYYHHVFIFPPISHFFSLADRFFPNPSHIFPRPLLNPKPYTLYPIPYTLYPKP